MYQPIIAKKIPSMMEVDSHNELVLSIVNHYP